MDEIAKLRAELAELRARVRSAEDYRDLVNLQGAYGYYVDKGLWDNAAELFAEDGTLEIAGRGVYVGRERVREYLHHLPAYGYGVNTITCSSSRCCTSTAKQGRPMAAGVR